MSKPYDKEFKSPDEIVDILFERLKDDDGVDEFITQGPTAYHHSLGRDVRNEFLLWDENNPHTMKDYEPELRGNVDYNPKHPDNTSGKILDKLNEKIKEYKG